MPLETEVKQPVNKAAFLAAFAEYKEEVRRKNGK